MEIKSKLFRRCMAYALAFIMAIGTALPVSAAEAEPMAAGITPRAFTGKTYYVSNTSGNDTNDGLSEATAWKTFANVNAKEFQPGDKLLLDRASVWDDQQLAPKGSGVAGSPIIIDMYGEGTGKPRINARNMEWDPSYNYNENIAVDASRKWNAGVVFYNQQYWEINNLEVTNFSPNLITYTGYTEQAGNAVGTVTKIPPRYGIVIIGKDAGTLRHMYVSDCYIHGINAEYSIRAGIGRGAIVYLIRGNTVPTLWDDIIVSGNRIGNRNDLSEGLKVKEEHPSVGHYGVVFHGSYVGGSGIFPYESGIPMSERKAGGAYSTNIVVRDNYFQDVGNAVVCFGAVENGVMEHNVSDHCNSGPNGNVPFWWHDTKNVVAQFNEVFDSGASSSKEDSQAFDADIQARYNVVQYNYTHDNPSGSFFECDSNTEFISHYRYNLSVNDGSGVNSHGNGAVITYLNSGNANSRMYLYNNDIYMKPGQTSLIGTYWDGNNTSKPHYFFNNFIYDNGSGGKTNTGETDLAYSANFLSSTNFDNNYYSGTRADKIKPAADVNAKMSGSVGISELDAKINKSLADLTGWERVNDFVRDGGENSALYRTGKPTEIIGEQARTGGYTPNGGLDILGNYVSPFNKPSIGAYEIGADTTLPEDKLVSDFSDAADKLTGTVDANSISYSGANWRSADNGEKYGKELYWNSTSADVRQAAITIPAGYTVYGFSARTENAAKVTVTFNGKSKTFYLSSAKNSFITEFEELPGTESNMLIDISSPWGANGVYFDDLIISNEVSQEPPVDKGTNIALNKTAVQSGGTGAASNGNDGDVSTKAGVSSVSSLPYTWTLDLGAISELNFVDVEWPEAVGNNDWKYKLEYSVNSTAWGVIADYSQSNPNTGLLQEQTLNKQSARYLRLTISGLPDGESGDAYFGELRAYGKQLGTAAPNVAQGKTTGMYAWPGNTGPLAVDGDESTMAGSGNASFPYTWGVDLGQLYSIESTEIVFEDIFNRTNNGGLSADWKYRIEYSYHDGTIASTVNDSSWTTLVEYSGGDTVSASVKTPYTGEGAASITQKVGGINILARHFRVLILAAPTGLPGAYAGMAEFRAFGIPTEEKWKDLAFGKSVGGMTVLTDGASDTGVNQDPTNKLTYDVDLGSLQRVDRIETETRSLFGDANTAQYNGYEAPKDWKYKLYYSTDNAATATNWTPIVDWTGEDNPYTPPTAAYNSASPRDYQLADGSKKLITGLADKYQDQSKVQGYDLPVPVDARHIRYELAAGGRPTNRGGAWLNLSALRVIQKSGGTVSATNVALNKPATVSKQETPNHGAANANNGSYASPYAGSAATPITWTVDLQGTYKIDEIIVYHEPNKGANDPQDWKYILEYSTDGSTWKTVPRSDNQYNGVADYTDNSSHPWATAKGPGNEKQATPTAIDLATHLRIRFTGTPSSPRNTDWYGIWEFEAFGTPVINEEIEYPDVAKGAYAYQNISLNGRPEASADPIFAGKQLNVANAGLTGRPTNATDGNTSTFSGNTNLDSDNPAYWLAVDLEALYNVYGFEVVWDSAGKKDWKYKIQYSSDGIDWKDAANYSSGGFTSAPAVQTTSGVNALGRYFRVLVEEESSFNSDPVRIAEFKVFGIYHSTPEPNIALGKTVTGTIGNAARAVDGRVGGAVPLDVSASSTAGQPWGLHGEGQAPVDLKLDLGAIYDLNQFHIEFEDLQMTPNYNFENHAQLVAAAGTATPGTGYASRDNTGKDHAEAIKYKVEYSTDNSTWETLWDYTEGNPTVTNEIRKEITDGNLTEHYDPNASVRQGWNYAPWTYDTSAETSVEARYVRVTLTGTAAERRWTQYVVSEVRAYGEFNRYSEPSAVTAENIAFGKPVLPLGGASTDPRLPEVITDGSMSTSWTADGDGLRIDLGLEYEIETVKVTFGSNASGSFSVSTADEASEDADDSVWDSIGSETIAANTAVELDANGVQARYLLLSVPNGVDVVKLEAEGTEVPGSGDKNIMILGAHPDDEALMTSGVIKRALENGDNVYIVVATLGDYNGTGNTGSHGQARMIESINAMAALGVPVNNLYYLAFADTGGLDEFGMTGTGNYYAGSFLYRLYTAEDPDQVFSSRHGGTKTYGGTQDSYHKRFFGEENTYTRNGFMTDLQDALDRVRPDEVYTTSRYDLHGDHAALGLFTAEALINIRREDPDYKPILHETFIHSCAHDQVGSDPWPALNSDAAGCLPFGMPSHLDTKTAFEWNRRESITVPQSMRVTPFSSNLKTQVLNKYTSQVMPWIVAFAKYDEFFWVRDFDNIAFFAEATASSESSGIQTAAKAIDGIRDGYAETITGTHIRDDHPERFPFAEWVSGGQEAEEWLKLDWKEKIYSISEITLYDRPHTGEQIEEAVISFTGADGKPIEGADITVGPLPDDGKAVTVALSEELEVCALTLTITEAAGSSPGLAEIEIKGEDTGRTRSRVSGTVTVNEDIWTNFSDGLTFGAFYKLAEAAPNKTFSISAEDLLGETVTVQYYISEKELADEEIKAIAAENWAAYTVPVELSTAGKKVIYAKLTNESGDIVYINSGGIVIYQDSTAVETDIAYTKGSESGSTLQVTLNGNTVNKIMNGENTLTAGTDYTVSVEGLITFASAWLDSLAASETAYALKIYYDPQGVVFAESAKNDIPAVMNAELTVTAAAETPKAKAEITPEKWSFDGAMVGYEARDAKEFTITNTGTTGISGLTASLEGGKASSFEISTDLSAASIAAGGKVTVSVRPKTGLPVAASSYEDALLVTDGGDIDLEVALSFLVSADDLDHSKPIVLSVTPDGTDAAISGELVITFDELMDKNVTGTVKLDGKVLGAGTWDSETEALAEEFAMLLNSEEPETSSGTAMTAAFNFSVYTVPYSGLDYETLYNAEISYFADVAGNEMETDDSHSFKTVKDPGQPEETDKTAPTVVLVKPDGTAENISGNIVITFSEKMASGAGEVKLLNGTALTGGTWNSGGTEYTIPYSGLAYGTKYTIEISAFEDISENVMQKNSSHSFTTEKESEQPEETDKTAPTVVSSRPITGSTGIARSGNIVITFSEAMDTSAGTVTLSGTALTGGTWSNGNKTYTVAYSGLGYSQNCTVAVEGFKDAAGNVLAAPEVIRFTTVRRNSSSNNNNSGSSVGSNSGSSGGSNSGTPNNSPTEQTPDPIVTTPAPTPIVVPVQEHPANEGTVTVAPAAENPSSGAAVDALAREKAQQNTGLTVTRTGDAVKVSGNTDNSPTVVKITPPATTDTSKVTTMAVLNSDGTLTVVPTRVNPDGTLSALIRGDAELIPLNVATSASFTDIGGLSQYEQNEVNRAAQLMIVTGMGDGTYDPTGTVTVQQTVVMFTKSIGLPVAWDTAMAVGQEHALITADAVATDAMSRVETAAIMVNAMRDLGMQPTLTRAEAEVILTGFTDTSTLSDEELIDLAICVQLNLFAGYGDGTIRPRAELQRSHMASLAVRFQTLILSENPTEITLN